MKGNLGKERTRDYLTLTFAATQRPRKEGKTKAAVNGAGMGGRGMCKGTATMAAHAPRTRPHRLGVLRGARAYEERKANNATMGVSSPLRLPVGEWETSAP